MPSLKRLPKKDEETKSKAKVAKSVEKEALDKVMMVKDYQLRD
jgi:hypothetical protein